MSLKDAKISELAAQTVLKIEGCEKNSGEARFFLADGRVMAMYHSQDCCESVGIEEITGDISDLIGSPITKAEEVDSRDEPAPPNADSYTWTFYQLATVKGYVTLRWLGESNGYYSERVDIAWEENRGSHQLRYDGVAKEINAMFAKTESPTPVVA